MLLDVNTNHTIMHDAHVHEHHLIKSMRDDGALRLWTDSSKVFYPKSFYAAATNKKNNKVASASLNKIDMDMNTRTISDQRYFRTGNDPVGAECAEAPIRKKSFKRTRILENRDDSEPLNENRSSFMTPSLSSVMSQVKKSNSAKTISGECPIHEALLNQSVKRKFSEETQSDCSSLNSSKTHPLTDEIADTSDAQIAVAIDEEVQTQVVVPKMKIININDLDLFDNWDVKDLVDLFPPVYERHSQLSSPALSLVPSSSDARPRPRPTSVDFHIVDTRSGSAPRRKSKSNSTNENMIYENDLVELEQWPSSASSPSEPNGSTTSNDLLLPNKRIRQKSLNTNFLKLYSIETSCKRKNILPEVEVDDHLLKQLTYSEIWSLDIKKEPKVSTRDIKLALITRKKLWSDMVHETRNDLFGDSTPWNLHFSATASKTAPAQSPEHSNEPATADSKSSLVRVHSDVKPWFNNGGTMLKPCGKLNLGKITNTISAPTREIQYVVKGWCDSRFL
ncbi:gis3p [Saccharomyces arboricola H-6]|uniref:Gis3p n=1 Tax=Saccharomyces arboricola (strain H-6 / AS 2.3317 / CBS 10644) TaxID=1160507 RepID=J8Q573_SACAR|nr:gis3p [Saccharomyces arboricola H-6]